MRLATIVDDRRGLAVGVVRDDGIVVLPPDEPTWGSVRAVAAGGPTVLSEIADWLAAGDRALVPLDSVTLAPVVPDPGAIYTIGHNYRSGDGPDEGPERPLVYGKAASSVGAPGATLSWDRTITDNVDAEVELGVVIGAEAWAVRAEDAMRHVFGYTCVNDVSSRDPWLDGDQWLLGKSMPGFCPIGPWVVTADELDPSDLGLTCTIDGEPIQDGRTTAMRFGIREVIAYLSRHAVLRPGDVVVTGTPERLTTPPGPGRRLRTGDEVTVAIEGIGAVTTHIR